MTLKQPTAGRTHHSLDELIETVAGGGFKEQIELERGGVSLKALKQLAASLGWTPAELLVAIGCPAQLRFARGTACVRGMPCLRCVELVRTQQLVRQLHDGTVDRSFDLDKWLGRWLMRPTISFGGRRPIDWFDTPSGAEYARYVIRAVDTGTYI
jgi:hypothetical protein